MFVISPARVILNDAPGNQFVSPVIGFKETRGGELPIKPSQYPGCPESGGGKMLFDKPKADNSVVPFTITSFI